MADYRGAARRRPWLVVRLVVCLVGLIGTPPTAVFLGKLTVFTATVDAGLSWLAVLAVLNTIASVFYLRWIWPALRRELTGDGAVLAPASTWGAVSAHSAAVASLVLGVAAGPVLAVLGG